MGPLERLRSACHEAHIQRGERGVSLVDVCGHRITAVSTVPTLRRHGSHHGQTWYTTQEPCRIPSLIVRPPMHSRHSFAAIYAWLCELRMMETYAAVVGVDSCVPHPLGIGVRQTPNGDFAYDAVVGIPNAPLRPVHADFSGMKSREDHLLAIYDLLAGIMAGNERVTSQRLMPLSVDDILFAGDKLIWVPALPLTQIATRDHQDEDDQLAAIIRQLVRVLLGRQAQGSTAFDIIHEADEWLTE